jgi:hypothetical protein
MDVEPSMSHPNASHGWEPGKCISQSEKPPRYLISLTRVGEHTQFMREHALINKFLGIWPSEHDLTRWIQDWWNPKGDYEVQLNSKGFFMIILYNLEDKDKIFDNGPYFYNSIGLFFRFWIDCFSPKRKTSQWIQCGSDYTPFLRSYGWKKSLWE